MTSPAIQDDVRAPALHPLVFDDLQPGGEGERLHLLSNPLHGVRVQLQVCVGHADLTVGQLLGAREHGVLALDRHIDEVVDLLLDGQVVARGELVAVDDHFGVRITELPLPMGL